MNDSPILDSEFAAAVMAVPSLARRADYSPRGRLRRIDSAFASLNERRFKRLSPTTFNHPKHKHER
ncbi:hypothetical protein [Paraburkholderia sp. SIMBA_030]|uniref:hypothetical protein n=1 Tax=Paraburkholderia sp. SIMBA_030 TaxID=3085773 RepID=UPI00397D2660